MSEVEQIITLLQAKVDEHRRNYRVPTSNAIDAVLENLPIFKQYRDRLIEMYAPRVEFMTEVSGSARSDYRQAGWYQAADAPRPLWEALVARLQTDPGLAKALPSIDSSTDWVMFNCAQPFDVNDQRKGLVVGNVQSGKTANYTGLIAKAVDAGYQLVIVLAGVHNNLRLQTQRRLMRDLNISGTGDWYLLTTDEDEFNRTELSNARSNARQHRRMLAVTKKNATRLRNLRDFLEAIPPAELSSVPVLIIDDESDQATPDSSNTDDDPSTINQLLREIWRMVGNGTYVAYTATPFANVLMDPEDQNGLPSLYPSDFIHVLPQSDDYFGAQEIFGLAGIDEEWNNSEGLDVIRPVDNSELNLLRPARREDTDSFEAEVTPSLASAIRWFLVATAIRRLRGQQQAHSTMLIHTTHRTKPHFSMRNAVDEYLEELREEVLDGNFDTFRALYRDEYNRASEVRPSGAGSFTWSDLSAEILNVVNDVSTAVDNSDKEADRLSYPDPRHHALAVIVVGGGTLSRGLTLEGLFVSFFTRSSNTYDTLLQMGRWFGYRPGYADLQRVWLSEGLADDYRFLARVEQEMRDDISDMITGGKTPDDIGVRILKHPGRLQITSPAKMRHATEVEVDFEGARLQTYAFDATSTAPLDNNVEAASQLVDAVGGDGVAHPTPSEKSRARVFTGIPLTTVRAFVDAYQAPDAFAELHKRAMDWTEENLPDVPWNVVFAAGENNRYYSLGDHHPVELQASNRSAIRGRGGMVSDSDVSIGVLMAGNDMVADLRLLQLTDDGVKPKLTIPQMKGLRRRLASGHGLLIVYPIDRASIPRANRGTSSNPRQPLKDAFAEKLPPGSTFENDSPLIGYGLVMPYDINNTIDLSRRGIRVAVTPNAHFYLDDEELAETSTHDNETDNRVL